MEQRIDDIMAQRIQTTRLAQSVAGKFPRVEVQIDGLPRSITVFGFVHGYGGEFQKHSKSTKHAIESAIGNFKPGDYILAEGYEDDLARRVVEKDGVDFSPQTDHIDAALISRYQKLLLAERFEWYEIFPWTADEQTYMEAIERAKREKRAIEVTQAIRGYYPEGEVKEALRRFFEQNVYERKVVEQIKEQDIHNGVLLSGLAEPIVREIIEKRTTFRSLLAARTALWRATKMDVKIFMGALHGQEVVDFILDSKATEDYVRGLPEWLRHIYDQNEFYQKHIMQTYDARFGQALSKNFAHLFLRWVAYKAYEIEYGLNPGCLDYSDYRTTLGEIKQNTKPTDQCPCLSGANFGKCCSDVMDVASKI